MIVTNATRAKLDQLAMYVERECGRQACIQAVVAIGSVGAGRAGASSDIDAFVFMSPLDLYAVPAEFAWVPETGAVLSIFAPEAETAIAFDFTRVDLAQWRSPGFDWPEPHKAELAAGTVVFDRDGSVSTLISARTAYSDEIQRARLDDAITRLDQLLAGDGPRGAWDRHGPTVAHDRLKVACDSLLAALFALNRRWRPWPSRALEGALALNWLPGDFEPRMLTALIGGGRDLPGFEQRVAALRAMFADCCAQATALGLYGPDPVSDAFIRSHDEPGRAWNMADWRARHAA